MVTYIVMYNMLRKKILLQKKIHFSKNQAGKMTSSKITTGTQIIKYMWWKEINPRQERNRWDKSEKEYPVWAIQMVTNKREPNEQYLQTYKNDIIAAFDVYHPYRLKLYWSLRTLYGNSTPIQDFEQVYYKIVLQNQCCVKDIICYCLELKTLNMNEFYSNQSITSANKLQEDIVDLLKLKWDAKEFLAFCLWWECRDINCLTELEQPWFEKYQRAMKMPGCNQIFELKTLLLTPLDQMGLKGQEIVNPCSICKIRTCKLQGVICSDESCFKKRRSILSQKSKEKSKMRKLLNENNSIKKDDSESVSE